MAQNHGASHLTMESTVNHIILAATFGHKTYSLHFNIMILLYPLNWVNESAVTILVLQYFLFYSCNTFWGGVELFKEFTNWSLFQLHG